MTDAPPLLIAWHSRTGGSEALARAAAEGAGTAVTFASGMAAVSGAFLALLRSGERILAHRTLYGCTHSLLTSWMPRLGIQTTFLDLARPERLVRAL